MAKLKEVFVCQNCGARLAEMAGSVHRPAASGIPWWPRHRRPAARPARRRCEPAGPSRPSSLAAEAALEQPRLATGSAELDRVLGGGLVPGSVTLIGGDPGIGKSTLMLQAAARARPGRPGALRHRRGVAQAGRACGRAAWGSQAATARLIAETQVEHIVGAAASLKARVLIVDSIQTMYSERIEAAPGAVSQLRECTARTGALRQAERHRGAAGRPRHQGRRRSPVRACSSTWWTRCCISRAIPAAASACSASVKNRFGAANEIGVFAMAEQGLREVTNPSAIFLSRHARTGVRQRHHGHARGHAPAADRSAGAGGCQPGRQPAPGRRRHRRQPAHDAARGGAPPRRACMLQARTCSPTWSAACGSRRPPATSRSCSRRARACAIAPLPHIR